MNKRLLVVLAALASVLLVVTGAAAGILIAGNDGEDDRPSQAASKPSQTEVRTGRGYLGLTVSLGTPGTGLRVATIESDGPADQAGINVGDVIRAVDDDVVRTPEKLRSVVEARK